MGSGARSLIAAAPVPPAGPAFARSRPWASINEVLAAWWGFAPDLVLAPRLFKPVDRCRAPCIHPCFLTCPGRFNTAPRIGKGAACRAQPDRGGAGAEGAALDLSKEHLRTQTPCRSSD
jgi:hypothetical protein